MSRIAQLNASRPGPFVIVGRPHSGTRAVTEALIEAGVFTGAEITPGFLDSEIWFARYVLPILSDARMPGLLEANADGSAAALLEERLNDSLDFFFRGHDPVDARPWGWKLSETLFFMRELLAKFPGARFIHVIRDGRDVSLSDGGRFQLTMPGAGPRDPGRLVRKAWTLLNNPHQRFIRRFDYRRFCEIVTFGESGLDRWRHVDLNDGAAIAGNRYLLQMQSWMHCVSTARSIGRELGPAYLEIRYEDFCESPVAQATALYRFLEIEPPQGAIERLAATVSTARIGKWQQLAFEEAAEADDFAAAVAHGKGLLTELGYGPDGAE